jgi:hypothetical protein
MPSHDEDNEYQPGSCSDNNGRRSDGVRFEPCACCAALAQVRVRHCHESQNNESVEQVVPRAASSSKAFGKGSSNGDKKNKDSNGSEAENRKIPSFVMPKFLENYTQQAAERAGKRKAIANDRDAVEPKTSVPADSGEQPAAQNSEQTAASSESATKETDPKAASDSAHSSPGVNSADWSEELKIPKERKLWHGLDGLAVTVLGIALPAFMFIMSCLSMPKRVTLVLLNHPVETSVEMALIAIVPVVNYLVWTALCRNKLRFPRLSAAALGASAASAMIVTGVCTAALFAASHQMVLDSGTDFSVGFSWMAFLSLISAAASIFIVLRIRATRDFANSKKQIVVYSAVGAMLPLISFAAAEARPWCIRNAEHMAVSTVRKERREGLVLLRKLDPERELRMECSDPRAAGLCGLFIPIKPSSQHELYFALTGKPYSFREFNNTDMSSMPDDFLSRNVVGEEIPGLSLTRSTMTSVLHPKTMTAALSWTFVFKNDTASAQEARAEIGLPPGALVTGLTAWTKGEAQDGEFVASGKADGISNWSEVGHDSPAIVTDLGHDRVLMHCFPVPQEEESKIRISMVVPLNPERSHSASITMPSFIASNFGLDNGEHTLRVRGPEPIVSGITGARSGQTPGHEHVISGTLSVADLKSAKLLIETHRSDVDGTVTVLDTLAVRMAQEEQKRLDDLQKRRAKENEHPAEQLLVMVDGSRGINNQIDLVRKALAAKSGKSHVKRVIKTVPARYVIESVARVSAAAPKHLVVVVDGSATAGPYAEQLTNALSKLPKAIPCDVIIASQEDPRFAEPIKLANAFAELKNVKFIGGQDNLKAVVKAAELAGETKRSAVLWIHGPQPVLNQEIYIMSAYASAPSFYEMTLGTGETDTFAFFKNHPEIGPFHPVPRTSNRVGDDLVSFFGRWTPDSSSFAVKLAMTTKLPAKFASLSEDEANEVVALHAGKRCRELLSEKRTRMAAAVAVRYGFVSPVSSVLITTNSAATHEGDSVDAFDPNGPEKSATGEGEIHQQGDASSSTTEAQNSSETESSDSSTESSGGAAPKLQGATNGTIGPQGISGVNCAGTVRVNNLANLEALLNIFANLGEIGLLLCGLVLTIHGIAGKKLFVDLMGQEIEVGAGRRITIGVALMLLGLATPSVVNWFVASARDANLFS